jgi:insecticidal toxin complex protein TccC
MFHQSSPQEPLSVQRMGMPSGGSTIEGMGEHFQSNGFSGEFRLAVPVVCSPCRESTPSLELAYSSFAGSGAFGQGFALSLSSIARRTAQHVPRYDDTDTFLLDGTQLVPMDTPVLRTVNGIAYRVTRYRRRCEEVFDRIERWDSETEPEFWRVIDRQSGVWLYGRTDAARVSDPRDTHRIFEWLVEVTFSVKGDVRHYVYKPEDDTGIGTHIDEQNRVRGAHRYIERIMYGNDVAYFSPDGGISPLPGQTWHFEVVFDYGEYGVNVDNDDPYAPTGPWLARKDPSSDYRAGFEQRIHRLCRNILMFHFFPAELGDRRVLVHTTQLSYAEDASRSLLSSCQLIGYQYFAKQPSGRRYIVRPAPALLFDYTRLDGAVPQFMPLLDVWGSIIEDIAGEPSCTLVPLCGEGVPGILTISGASVLYRAPVLTQQQGRDEVSWSAKQEVGPFPGLRETFPEMSLCDLDGDGILDFVKIDGSPSGYYRSCAGGGWEHFTPFECVPTDRSNAQNRFADLTGNGRADLVMKTWDTIAYYPSEGERGFGAVQTQPADPSMPPILMGDDERQVIFADVIGGGMASLARIADGVIECWPSLGYGRFGDVVRMSQVPRYAGEFGASCVYLADLSGTGTPDLIYAYADRVEIYQNNNGNTFATTPLIVSLPRGYSRSEQLRFADLCGNGYQCLIFSSDDPDARSWYLDLCHGATPYLLSCIDNTRGQIVTVSYRSSAYFYLEDQEAGNPWTTPLPFPLQLVSRVATTDHISDSRTCSTFHYHHGYYDHVEREFRGFGLVEHFDAEFDNGLDTANGTRGAGFVAPALTKTWYHTGAWSAQPSAEAAYRAHTSYDAAAYPMPPSRFQWLGASHDAEAERQAHLALSGQVLREELLAADGEGAPYKISEYNYLVRELQSPEAHVNGVYALHGRETILYDYERAPLDPRIQHHFVLEVDADGEVTLEASVAYPRRPKAEIAPGQDTIRVSACRVAWHSIKDQPDGWLLGVPAEQKTCALEGLAEPTVRGLYYAFDDIHTHVNAALGDAPPAGITLTITSWYRHRYLDDPASGAPVRLPALLIQEEEGAFADSLIRQLFDQTVYPGDLARLLEDEGGYSLCADGFWWAPSIRQTYGPPAMFYLLTATSDPLAGRPHGGTTVDYAYDRYNLLLLSSTISGISGDVLPSMVVATQMDYCALAACQIRDENGNYHEAIRDPLGMVTALSFYGTVSTLSGPQRFGFAALDFAVPLPHPSSLDDLVTSPGTYIGGAARYFYYDVESWRAGQVPAHSAELTAQAYPNVLAPSELASEVAMTVTYYDGDGRRVSRLIRVEPGMAFLCDGIDAPGAGGNGIVKEGYADQRWLNDSRVRYNNKGLPLSSYKPCFVSTHRYVRCHRLANLEVASTVHYDALGRIIRVEEPRAGFPDAYFTRTVLTPWSSTEFDQNDTIKDSPYFQYIVSHGDEGGAAWERDALVKASANCGTPVEQCHDNLGYVIRQRSALTAGAAPLVTQYGRDALGNELWSCDPRLGTAGLKSIQRQYALTGDVLVVITADGGTRHQLWNVLGDIIFRHDSRGFRLTWSYDSRQRIVTVQADGGDQIPPLANITQRLIYGDSLDATGKPPVEDPAGHNLIGRIHRQYDPAGSVEIASYHPYGGPLASTRRIRADYRSESDWRWGDGTEDWNGRIAQLSQRLSEDRFTRQIDYDALGQTVGVLDPVGNRYEATYHVSGLIDTVAFIPRGGARRLYATGIEYTPHGERQRITFGGVDSKPVMTTEYTYDPDTLRLARISTTRVADQAVLQDLRYYYDPVGNVTHVENRASQPSDAVSADLDFTFDALYRLVNARGRAVSGYSQVVAESADYAPFATPLVENYSCQYTYDDGNNLTLFHYTAPSSSWMMSFAISPRSNRAVPLTDIVNPASDPTERCFDAGGNQTALAGFDTIVWNYRNNIARTTRGQVAEFMLYDASGNRVVKVVEDAAGTPQGKVEQTTFLRELELQRTTSAEGRSELQRVVVAVDDSTIAVRLTDAAGGPAAGDESAWLQLHDLLDSAVIEVDDQGQLAHSEEYLPFGATACASGRAGAPPSDHKTRRYSGRERDGATGLYYYGLRYYACWLGRWLSPDPALDADGLNLYRFARNNPVTLVDVFGLIPTPRAPHDAAATHIPGGGPGGNGVTHQQRRTGSSKLRYFRRLQRGLKNGKNIGMLKLTKQKRGLNRRRRVLYLIAFSMGQGVNKLTLAGETHMTQAGTPKKRGHSEAVLRAARQIGKVTKSGARARTFKLNTWTIEYAASTNEACTGQENCRVESVPHLDATHYYFLANYAGSGDAGATEQMNNNFQAATRKDRTDPDFDESEVESENDDANIDTVVLDDASLRGVDLGAGLPASISGQSIGDYFQSLGPDFESNRFNRDYGPQQYRTPPRRARRRREGRNPVILH